MVKTVIDSRWGFPTVGLRLNVSELKSMVDLPLCWIEISYKIYVGEVIFDRNHPALPPDIIVSSEDERMAFNPDIDQLLVCTVCV